jgi:hypothetical protein
VGGRSFFAFWQKTVYDTYEEEVTSIGNSVGMSFAKLIGGEFQMGSPEDEPGRDADETLQSQAVGSVFMGVTPVTQEHWFAVMGTEPSEFVGGDKPVESVSFAEAQRFCSRLSRLPAEIRAGRRYRLPTEAEWEWAVRAGTTTAYHFGNDPADLTDYGWYEDNSGGETRDVLSKGPNDWQLYDMPGNVWEWCFTSRLGDTEGFSPVRGGAWNSPAEDCRSASRDLVAETAKRNDIGFRVICDYTPPPPPGVCEFVVELDEVEVYRNDCYGGQSCRDSSDSTGVTIGYDTGTLRWTKQLFRPLEPGPDPETGCTTWFCGDCHCTCKCLCVTITEPDGTILRGEICDVSYSDCDAPQWAGTVGGRSISLTLDRDQYTGECIIGGSIGGEDADWVAVAGCQDLAASLTLGDYTTVAVACKECSCEELREFPCCPGLDFPDSLFLTLLSQNTECGCLDGQVIELPFFAEIAGKYQYRSEAWKVPCLINGDPDLHLWYRFRTECGSPENFEFMTVESATGTASPPPEDAVWVTTASYLRTSGQCDPFYYYYGLDGPGSPQNDIWFGCENTSMDVPWIDLELTL